MRKLTKEEFISKSKLIHGDKYDYSLVDYVNNSTKIKIICQIHGIFEQTPHAHLKNQGCPACKESKGEKEIAKLLTEMNMAFEREKRFEDLKIVEISESYHLISTLKFIIL